MTDFAKTISNSIGVFGQAPTSKWGSFLWGQKWAYGSFDVQETMFKGFSLPISVGTGIVIGSPATITITNSLAVLEAINPEYLSDAEGFNFRFAGRSSNLATRAGTVWTELPLSALAYAVKSAATATTWTNASAAVQSYAVKSAVATTWS